MGLHLSMQSLAGTFWFLEGNTEIHVDGEEKPSVENVGTEDYFNGGWYFDQGPYVGPYSGVTVKDETLHRIAAYRFLIGDAIPFRSSIRVRIHHGEASRGRRGTADYASVAYWYQLEPHTPLPPLPEDPSDLLVRPAVVAPPPGYLLDPRHARPADARGARFVWRDDCGVDVPEDHEVYGGWEDPEEYHDYLAYGRARVRGVWRTGVLILAYPDGNRLSARWPLASPSGRRLRILTAMTDGGAQRTRTGATVRVALARDHGESTILSEDFSPADTRVIERTFVLRGDEKDLIVEVDNKESEFWSVVYLDASLPP